LEREQQIIEQTRLWIETVVVNSGFCPFAKPVLERESIHYTVVSGVDKEQCLAALIQECVLLDKCDEVETSLVIFADAFGAFDDYLDFVSLSEQLLKGQGYEGEYQLATFHPDYCFAQTAVDDPANFTNRSLYPMLHLLRESGVAQALAHYDAPERIPQRNIQYARDKGFAEMQSKLQACKKIAGGFDD